LASATGDIVTLILLAGCAVVLQGHMGKERRDLQKLIKRGFNSCFMHAILDSLLSTLVFLVMFAMAPLFGYIVWTNKHIKDLLFVGWTPIVCAMVISR
jgi:solute carrier family 41